MNDFRLPDDTHVGSAHLYTADLERSLAFYRDLMGFRELERANGTVTLSPDGRSTPLLLTERRGAQPKPSRTTGLYHVAIRLPSRRALARLFRRMVTAKYPFGGFSDHAVSEALYLDDPDGNGLELYRDRPRSDWPRLNDQISMTTEPLDIYNLLDEADELAWDGIDAGTDIGHVHLHVGDLTRAKAFWSDTLGLDVVFDLSSHGALFVSAGGYHHHLGLNTWAGSAPQPPGTLGLREFTLVIPGGAEDTAARLDAAGYATEAVEGGFRAQDGDGNTVVVSDAGG